MHDVARHLQVEAVKQVSKSAETADLFARSAFNRYYYAAFLRARETLVSIDAKYANSLSHKNVPDLLKGTIQKKLKTIQRKAARLDDTKLVNECHQASSQNLDFANVLEKAYATRVVADYTPTTAVDFRSPRFTLTGVTVTEADGWLSKADLWSTIILSVIRQDNA